MGKPQPVLNRVAVAGEFLERTARMNESDACERLTGIDFSQPVTVLKLPSSVFVQYVQKHRGVWFTDTGLTPDLVGLAEGKRVRRLFVPVGAVPALASTARAIKDTWTADRLFQSLSPTTRMKMGQLTRGGGKQYIVGDRFAMRPL
jgi:hypothetical protein